MQELLNFWKMRQLSLIGKITIIKTLALAKLVHLFTSLPTPGVEVMKKIKNILYGFLWNNKNDKIRRTKICQSYQNDGLKMVDLDCFVASLKCSWVKRLQCNPNADAKWVILSKIILRQHAENLTWYGETMLKKIAGNMRNEFWKNVLEAWASFTKCFESKPENILCEVIWCDEFLKYKTCLNKQWRAKGMFFLCDLMKGKELLTHGEIERKYGITLNFIDYSSIKIKMAPLIRLITNVNANAVLPAIPPRTFLVLHEPKIGQLVNRVLINKLGQKNWDINRKIQNKWIHETQKYRRGTLTEIRQITQSTSMQALHYRIVNRIIPTNTFMFKANLSDTNLCTFCRLVPETPGHLFVKCEKVQELFMNIVTLLRVKYNFEVRLEKIKKMF